MPYPYSYGYEQDLGRRDPERLLAAAESAAKEQRLTVVRRSSDELVVECPLERVLGDENLPTFVPLRLELSCSRDAAARRLRVRATFGVLVALGAILTVAPLLGALLIAPRRALAGLPAFALVLACCWLLLYLAGMLGARVWVRRRLEDASVL